MHLIWFTIIMLNNFNYYIDDLIIINFICPSYWRNNQTVLTGTALNMFVSTKSVKNLVWYAKKVKPLKANVGSFMRTVQKLDGQK